MAAGEREKERERGAVKQVAREDLRAKTKTHSVSETAWQSRASIEFWVR